MSRFAHNAKPEKSYKGILVILCALAPIVVGILMPNRDKAPKTASSSPSQTGSATAPQPGAPDAPALSGSGVDLTRFDARARAEQRDALRELKASEFRMDSEREEWSLLLQRHADGDKAAFEEFLGAITPENAMAAWETARGAKLSPEDRGRLYRTLGMAGGGDLVNRLIGLSDRDAALAVKGWAELEPAAAMDWFRQLDVRGDPRMQEYLAASNLIPESFLDRISDALLDSVGQAPNASDADDAGSAFANNAARLVESLMAEDPRKGEAMMREVTERFVKLYDSDAVADWFNQLDDPSVQGAAIQRIIEAGTFKDDPFQAVDVALSLDDPKSRGNAISAAFGQLGGGVGGIDPGSIAEQINAMPAGRDKDFAINGYAHGLVGKSPEAALQWAGSITDEGFRETVVRNVTRRIGAQSGTGGN